jgi:hypothetical protein
MASGRLVSVLPAFQIGNSYISIIQILAAEQATYLFYAHTVKKELSLFCHISVER